MTDRLATARAESAALLGVLHAALARIELLAPGMSGSRAFSTGSLVAHNRRAARIPPAADAMAGLTAQDKGLAAGAFSGPRVEAALVGIAMPMTLCDLNLAHPGSLSALKLTPFVIAETIEFRDVTEELEALLAAPDLLERLLDPRTAARWGPTLVSISSSSGAVFSASVDWIPTRHGGTVAPMFFPEGTGLPMFWFEAALAKALGGSFAVERAVRPVAGRPVWGLRPYRLLDGTTVDLRREDLGLALRRVRHRMGGPAKLASHVDTYGLGARHDQKSYDRAVTLKGFGRHGERLEENTRRPEYPAEYTSLLLSGAVSAFTKFAVGVTELLIGEAGGVVAHVATDAIVVPASGSGGWWPCPCGESRTPDGREAVRLLSHDELRSILSRIDPLLGFDAHPAWKEVVSC